MVLLALLGALGRYLRQAGWLGNTAAPMTGVQVVILGEADPDAVAAIVPAVAAAYGVPCHLVPGILALPPGAYTPQRRQYVASRLLAFVQ